MGDYAMELAPRRGRDHPIGRRQPLDDLNGTHDHCETQNRQCKQAMAFLNV
jgi:hypothetical protein